MDVRRAERELWIAHQASVGVVATVVVHDLLGGCQAVSTRGQADRDVVVNGGGKIYRIQIIIEEEP